jgi:hypothetical protein
MLINTTFAIDYHHYNDPKAVEWAKKEVEYRHAHQLIEAIGVGTNGKKRIQTFEKTWRFEPDQRYGFMQVAVIRLVTWVTWTSPVDCPIGDEVEHNDFERVIGGTARREHSYVVVPVFEDMPLVRFTSNPPIHQPYREKLMWFDRRRAMHQGSELRCWMRME